MRLLFAALAWCGGIIFAATLPAQSLSFWTFIGLAALTTAGLMIHFGGSRWVSLLIVVFMLGALRMAGFPASSELAAQNDRVLTVTGVVAGTPEFRDDGSQRFRLQAEFTDDGFEQRPVSGLALISTLSQQPIAYGDRIRATGDLRTPGRFDDFDYADFLARSGVFSEMQNAAVIVDSTGHGHPFTAAVTQLRERFGEVIQRTLPEPASGLLRGILLGTDGSLAPPIEDAFAATGSAHIIAISGFNMVIVGQTVFRLMLRFGAGRRTSVIAALLTLSAYMVFVGAGPAVLRAFLMTSVVIAGQMLRRRTYVPASIGFAALLITLENPTSLFDIGFQLSVAATLGIAAFTTPISRTVMRVLRWIFPPKVASRVADLLNDPLAASLAAQIAVTPLIALYFGRVSLVSPIVNLLIVPVQPLIIIAGSLGVILFLLVPLVGTALLWLTFTALSWSLVVIRTFAQLPFADVSFRISAEIILVAFVTLLGGHLMIAARPPLLTRITARVFSRPVIAAVALAVICLVTLSGMLIASRPDGRLHVWALDMNGANAILIRTPAGAHILVDGGSSPQRLLTALGDILPFYQRELDALILTAPIEANYRGLINVTEFYQFRHVFSHDQPNLSENYATLRQALNQSDQTLVTAGAALEWDDGVRLEFLHPSSQPQLEDDVGDESLVVRVQYGDVSFLLTGELTPEGQDQLLNSGSLLQSTVLQLPRHAMPRSLDAGFVSAVAPSALFAQTQRSSRRGDADPDVISTLPPVPVMFTHRHGTLHFWTDGSELSFVPETTALSVHEPR